VLAKTIKHQIKVVCKKEQQNLLLFQVHISVSFDPNYAYKLWCKPDKTIFAIIAWPSYGNNRESKISVPLNTSLKVGFFPKTEQLPTDFETSFPRVLFCLFTTEKHCGGPSIGSQGMRLLFWKMPWPVLTREGKIRGFVMRIFKE